MDRPVDIGDTVLLGRPRREFRVTCMYPFEERADVRAHHQTFKLSYDYILDARLPR